MTKSEKKAVKAEIKTLKKNLTNRQKESARRVKKLRATIRNSEIEITEIERADSKLLSQTNQRLAILEGRENS